MANSILPSASIEMAASVAARNNVIDMTWGQPDFDTPSHIKEAAIRAIRDESHGYTRSSGIHELREAIANNHHRKYDVSYDPQKEVVVTPGAKQALYYCMRVLLDPGDEVVIFELYWISYAEIVRMAGGVPRYIAAYPNMEPDISAVEDAINKRTKAIIINNPVNPSGYVFERTQLENIVDIANDKDLYIVADEIYDEIVFCEYCSFSQIVEAHERVLIVNGLSKTYSMTGWRVGYVIATKEIASKISLLQQHVATCVSVVGQYAAIAALTGSHLEVDRMRDRYRERFHRFKTAMSKVRVPVVSTRATFYSMLDMSQYGTGGYASWLMDKCSVATVDGVHYGHSAKNYVRISLALPDDKLDEAARRIADLCGE